MGAIPTSVPLRHPRAFGPYLQDKLSRARAHPQSGDPDEPATRTNKGSKSKGKEQSSCFRRRALVGFTSVTWCQIQVPTRKIHAVAHSFGKLLSPWTRGQIGVASVIRGLRENAMVDLPPLHNRKRQAEDQRSQEPSTQVLGGGHEAARPCGMHLSLAG